MFGLDVFMLARIQFAFYCILPHYFPAITIGLATYLAVLEGLWLKNSQSRLQNAFFGPKFLQSTLVWVLCLAW